MRDYQNESPYGQDFWDAGVYRTGSTRPPKRHGGLIAALFVVIILLCGAVSVLSLMNIRLFRQTRQQPDPGEDPLIFSGSTETTAPSDAATVPTAAPDATERTGTWTMPIAQSPASDENIPHSGGLSLQQIYARCIPSVVSISCAKPSGTSSGTGVVLTADGLLVTNCHVVDGAQRITVLFTDGQTMDAALVGADAVSDLAVLRVEADGLTPAEFGDSGALRVGDAVVAIGDPLGVALRGTMTDGIVSAINRDVTTGGRTLTLIQTNAALNNGNSGGPLINCYGQVIGINTLKIGDYSSAAGVEGLGFAIPSQTVKEIVDQLLSQGYVSGRPSLGITGESVSSFYQMFYHMPAGFQITAVSDGSEAEQKGLQPGDIVLSLNDTRITDADGFTAALYTCEVGSTATLGIYRGGRQYSLELTVSEAGA